MTEAGRQDFNNLLTFMNESLNIIDPALVIPETKYISTTELVNDVLNLLIGVPSRTFTFNKVCGQIYYKYYKW